MKKLVIYLLLVIGVFSVLVSSCKKAEDPPISNTVKDIEGNVFTTVTIGTQVWMVENLKTTKYNDNTNIPNVKDNTAWTLLKTPAYCWYNNDITNKSKYGALYNWYVVGSGRLAPKGWHIPSDEEWTILENYVSANIGTSISTAKALAAQTDWEKYGNPNPSPKQVDYDLTKNNSSGFTALPGGHRDSKDVYYSFFGIGGVASWWSTSVNGYGGAGSREIYSSSWDLKKEDGSDMERGFSVRCIKD